MRHSQQELEALVGNILADAAGLGATACEVSVSEDRGLAVSARLGELEKIEFNQDRGFGITVYLGHRKGSASTSDSSPESVSETIKAALNIAKYTEEDPCNGIADAKLMPTSVPDLDLFHQWDIDADKAADLAIECERIGLAKDKRIDNSDGAEVTTYQGLRVYGNSHGFVGSYSTTRHGFSCVLIAQDDNGMQRDYWYTVARDPLDLESAEVVGSKAAERALAKLSPQRTGTGEFPVLFSAQTASGLAGHLLGAISGGALYRKSSFLLDSLNTQVMSDHISLVEQPHLPKRLGSAAFDAEGVGTWSKAFVEKGTVKSYVLSSYSARKLGMETTGNAGGVGNLTLQGTTMPASGLFGKMGTGLYVTDLMGQGVNPVTGDYSRGASGFWVEQGEIAYPVDEITIACNLKDLFRDIVVLGDDLDERGNVRTPSVLVGAMTLASN